MQIIKVSDIKVKCNGAWESLRYNKIKSNSQWYSILPGTYRICHENKWYELNPINVDLMFRWFDRDSSFYITLSQYNSGTETPVSPKDERNLAVTYDRGTHIYPEETEVGTGFSKLIVEDIDVVQSNGSYVDYTEYKEINYALINNTINFPTLETDIGELSFGFNGGTQSITVSATSGSLEYYYGDKDLSNPSWTIDYIPPGVTAQKTNNVLVVNCLRNASEDDWSDYITLRHSIFPFISKKVYIKQAKNQEFQIEDADYILVQYSWTSSAGTDLDCLAGFTDTSISSLDNIFIGFTSGQSETYKKVFEFPAESPVLYWSGDTTSPQSSIDGELLPGEVYILDVKRFKEVYRNNITSAKILYKTVWWYASTDSTKQATLIIKSYKGGKISYDRKSIVNDSDNPAILTGSGSIQVYNIPVKSGNWNPSSYINVGDLNYIKGDTPDTDKFKFTSQYESE